MNNIIRLYSFWYGCIGSLGWFAWYISASFGDAAMPNNVWVAEAVFLLHATALMATFHRAPVRPSWPPVLSVTPGRVRLARILLGTSTINFIVCLGTFLVATMNRSVGLENKMVPLILSSFLLQNATYVAVHWAFRPENLFSGSFIRAISDPVGLLFSSRKK